MSSETVSEPELPASRVGWKNYAAWLMVCFTACLLMTPVFHAMPPRMKFIGIHAWALSVGCGMACGGAAASLGIRSRGLVGTVGVLMALASLAMLACWGHAELKLATSQRVPGIPIPMASSPEELARSLNFQRELSQALVPTLADYQRHRLNSPVLRRVRPRVLWGGELLSAGVVALIASLQGQRWMTVAADSGSLRSSASGS